MKTTQETMARVMMALTEYDRRQSGKKYYNHHALGLYMERLGRVREDIAAGAEVRAALCAAFMGPVLRAALRGAKLPPPTPDELRGGTGWCYVPASAAPKAVYTLPRPRRFGFKSHDEEMDAIRENDRDRERPFRNTMNGVEC